MGGDRAPTEIVAGAIQAAESGLPVVLVGDPARIGDTQGVPVLPASEVIEMHEDPGRAVRTKKDSSLVRAAEAVRDGRAAAMVSAGNTGATMASALLRMGRIRGVGRPAIATPIPVPGSTPTILLDAGANAECSAAWLVQFAQMGAAFARQRFGIAEPRVGLLSIGEEAGKGSPLVKETYALLHAGDAGPDVHFIGNVEGRDVMSEAVDVVVTDGFTGNVALKAVEGVAGLIADRLRREFEVSLLDRLAGLIARPVLRRAAAGLDPRRYNGACMVGLAGIVVKSHGRADGVAFARAIGTAALAARRGLTAHIAQALRAEGADT
jgi:phosphate acyltransferase